MHHSRWLWLVAALPACAAPGHGDPEVGAAPQGFVSDFFVVGDVVVDPATYHWAAPGLLLASSEGAGPRTLDVSVSSAVTPHISYTGTRTPSRSDLSAALGWDVGQTVQLDAETSVLVPYDAYARVDAYPAYQRVTWSLLALGQVVVGGGTAYKPIGVYFDTCGCIGPDPCGVGCVAGLSSPGGITGAAGAPDAGGSTSSAPPTSDGGKADVDGG